MDYPQNSTMAYAHLRDSYGAQWARMTDEQKAAAWDDLMALYEVLGHEALKNPWRGWPKPEPAA